MFSKQGAFVAVMLMLASLACLVSDVKDAVETINKGVQLLQEIDESGTWKYISEGMDGLNNTNGYAAAVTVTRGTTNDAGDTITRVTETLVWNIRTDADDDSMIEVIRDGETRSYLIVDNQAYRIEDGRYFCLQSGQNEEEIFAAGVDGAFFKYSAESAGVQVMSVAESAGSETVNGFDTEKYTLISKLQEALDILKEFPSEELQQEIADVPPFYINGVLNVDKTTRALIRFDAQYANLDKKEGNAFRFEVTELGNQPDFTAPEPDQISQACTQPTPTPEG